MEVPNPKKLERLIDDWKDRKLEDIGGERPDLEKKLLKEIETALKAKLTETQKHLKELDRIKKWMLEIFPPEHPFFKVYEYLLKKPTKQTSAELSEYLPSLKRGIYERVKGGKKKDKIVYREFVLLTVDYEDMYRKVDLSIRQCQRYVSEFARVHIMERLGRRGRRGQAIYAIGTWINLSPMEKKRNPFLHESKEWKKRLKEMDFHK